MFHRSSPCPNVSNSRYLRWSNDNGRAIAVFVQVSVAGGIISERRVSDLLDGKGQAVLLILVNAGTGQAALAVAIGGASHRDRRVKAPTAHHRGLSHRVLILINNGDDNSRLPVIAIARSTQPGQIGHVE